LVCKSKTITMNNFFIFGEIFLRVGSLMLLIYLIFSAYLFIIATQNREISDDDKIRLKTLAVGFAGISLMILFKQMFPQVTEYSEICGIKCILAGNILQLFLPVQLYFFQKKLQTLIWSFRGNYCYWSSFSNQSYTGYNVLLL